MVVSRNDTRWLPRLLPPFWEQWKGGFVVQKEGKREANGVEGAT